MNNGPGEEEGVEDFGDMDEDTVGDVDNDVGDFDGSGAIGDDLGDAIEAPGELDNFDDSDVVTEDDGYGHDLTPGISADDLDDDGDFGGEDVGEDNE